jgi:putative protein-disulfide isomerase
MDGPHLVYFADPMCSWCWGFAPVIEAVARAYGARLPVRVVMGGLRPGTTAPMTDKARAEIRHHWDAVAQASGQAFDYKILAREDFIYDTDPAARAVVLARRVEPAVALALLGRLQRAFYAEGRDVTSPPVLADLAAALGFDRAAFEAGLGEPALKEETVRDYAVSQRAGITGFPTLIIGPQADGTFAMVTQGFNTLAPVAARIETWVAAQAASGAELAPVSASTAGR